MKISHSPRSSNRRNVKKSVLISKYALRHEHGNIHRISTKAGLDLIDVIVLRLREEFVSRPSPTVGPSIP
jgi:hypothetical protein